MASAIIDTETPDEMWPLEAIVIYDEDEAGCRAKAFLDHVAAAAGGGFQLRPALWRIDRVADPVTSREVFGDLRRSSILALAVSAGSELPNSALDRVEWWARCRPGDDSALVILGKASPAAVEELVTIAERFGIQLFCEPTTQAALGSQNYRENVPEREPPSRPRLEIPDDWRSGCYSQWGINE